STATPAMRAIFFLDMARILDTDTRRKPQVPCQLYELLQLRALDSLAEHARIIAGEIFGDGVEDALLRRGRDVGAQHAEKLGRRDEDQPVVAPGGEAAVDLERERAGEALGFDFFDRERLHRRAAERALGALEVAR